MASPKTPQPAPGDVAAIVTIENRVIRNLRITDCYARLSIAVREMTGDGANWCTFATWASRQAGCTIRGEDLGDRLADIAREEFSFRRPIRSLWRVLLRRGLFDPHSRLGRLVHAVHTPFDAFERASDAVAEGNRKVFEEIGFEFARYLRCCDDREAFDEFLDSLKAGPAPEGQDLLRAAFRNYQQARVEPSLSRRSQLLLLANLQIGFHEQTRLQPEIQRAMDAAPDTADDLKRRLLSHFGLGWIARMAVAVLAAPARAYQRFVRELTRRVISQTMMVLRTPEGLLFLGRGIKAETPAVFARFELGDLESLVSEVEPAAGTCSGCGAEDWAVLPQRMHYIYHLFAALHARDALFRSPFAAEQVQLIHSGRIPDGQL